MCGKASVAGISWSKVYAWATSLTPPATLPQDPESRINISPSRLRRKSDPDSMIWETLPVICRDGKTDIPMEATWPYLPPWSNGRLPVLKNGQVLSTANARLRHDGPPFAPTFMKPWNQGMRVIVVVSWFYEFDSRVKPQVPYAVFPLDRPFWAMAGLASRIKRADGVDGLSVAIITVDPNEILKSIGHHRSPALLQSPEACERWLGGSQAEAQLLLVSHPSESMGVEPVPMEIKIPGNQNIQLPDTLKRRRD